MKHSIALALSFVAVFLVAVGVSAAIFTESFTGSPPSPASAYSSLAGFDVTVDGAENGDQGFDAQSAHHGADCSPYPATHTVSSFGDAIFQCRDHWMTTAEGGDGKYTIIVATAPAMLDFSGGQGCASVDVSTFRASDRDWWELWLTPYADNLSEPHEDFLPAAQGEPRNAVLVRLEGGSFIQAKVVRNHDSTQVANAQYREFITPSANVRTPHEICLTRTSLTVKIGGVAAMDATFADLGWDSAVFQIAHSTYNPTKGSCVDGCGANTWHWDNVSLSSAIPFTIIRGDQRTFGQYQSGTVTFPTPAPANSYLRFAGLGNWEWLDGATWRPVARADQEMSRPEHAQNYWQPIPAGTTSVQLRGTGQDWNGSFVARDMSIWSLTTDGATPTASPTPTETPSPTPTASPSPTPTATPTASPTPSPTPSPTATASPTPTPAAAPCRVQVRKNGATGSWVYDTAKGSYEGTLILGECRR
jgi:hypothetical protein